MVRHPRVGPEEDGGELGHEAPNAGHVRAGRLGPRGRLGGLTFEELHHLFGVARGLVLGASIQTGRAAGHRLDGGLCRCRRRRHGGGGRGSRGLGRRCGRRRRRVGGHGRGERIGAQGGGRFEEDLPRRALVAPTAATGDECHRPEDQNHDDGDGDDGSPVQSSARLRFRRRYQRPRQNQAQLHCAIRG